MQRVAACRLTAGNGTWDYARRHAEEIDRHWRRRTAESPAFFNGTIFVLERHTLTGDQLEARLMPVEFKSFLHWKEHGYPDDTVRDCFGSALIRSAEGHVLLGRQRAGNINAGLAYLPGGFIDPRDVALDGTIDIAASISRELAEETGLGPGETVRAPGLILTFAGPMLSIAVEFRAAMAGEDLRARIRAHIAADTDSELEDAVIVRSAGDLADIAMPIYAEVLMWEILGAGNRLW